NVETRRAQRRDLRAPLSSCLLFRVYPADRSGLSDGGPPRAGPNSVRHCLRNRLRRVGTNVLAVGNPRFPRYERPILLARAVVTADLATDVCVLHFCCCDLRSTEYADVDQLLSDQARCRLLSLEIDQTFGGRLFTAADLAGWFEQQLGRHRRLTLYGDDKYWPQQLSA